MKFLTVLAILLFLFLGISCGKKMDPIPSNNTSLSEVAK